MEVSRSREERPAYHLRRSGISSCRDNCYQQQRASSMAEEFKRKRSHAQSTFSRRANAVAFNVEHLTEQNLVSELKALKSDYEELCNISFEYIAVMEEEDAAAFATETEAVREKLTVCRKSMLILTVS